MKTDSKVKEKQNTVHNTAQPQTGIVSSRITLIDTVRGVLLVSMIIYHACWDLYYLVGLKLSFFESYGAYVWQQSICWCFIFLSGICGNLSANTLKRGFIVSAAGILVTAVTLTVMPDERIVFGILTLIGASMLILGLASGPFERVSPKIGFFLSLLLFTALKPINNGYIGLLDRELLRLPQFLYRGYVMSFLGFTDPRFYSSDYFSVLPWLFLFLAGFFFGRIVDIKNKRYKAYSFGIPVIGFLGRHSLIVYLAHQPLLYLIVLIIQKFCLEL